MCEFFFKKWEIKKTKQKTKKIKWGQNLQKANMNYQRPPTKMKNMD